MLANKIPEPNQRVYRVIAIKDHQITDELLTSDYFKALYRYSDHAREGTWTILHLLPREDSQASIPGYRVKYEANAPSVPFFN